MKIRDIEVVILSVFLVGCSQKMYFVKPGGTKAGFQKACKLCEQQIVSRRMKAYYDSKRWRDYTDLNPQVGLAQAHASRSMADSMAVLIVASRGFDSDERESFWKCMEWQHGWIFQEERSQSEDSFKTILPPDIVGMWKAKDSPWRIVLSPKGKVSSAIIQMGEVQIKPNQTTTVEMKDGSFSTFKAGDCVVDYTPETRELFVSIEMEKIHVKFLDNVIDGNSIDRFIGPVSEDGKFWEADWITVFDYGPGFSQEPNDIFAKPLVFERIEVYTMIYNAKIKD